MTRELDEACARAMGWIITELPPADPWSQGPMDATHRFERDNEWRLSAPAYSTDPATDAEKVAWLRAKFGDGFGYIEITIWSPANTGDGLAVCATFDGRPGDFRVDGATMTEALARLVIAVAEAEAKR